MLRLECVENHCRKLGNELIGELMTIVETAIQDKVSRDATKSLVRQCVWRRMNNILNELSNLAKLQEEEHGSYKD